jgi:ferredoxin-type protein NapF
MLDLLASAGSLLKRKRETPVQTAPVAVSGKASGRRRSFLLIAAGAGLGLLSRRCGASRGENAPLRPPGSAGEDRFAGLCARCGNCLRSCPASIIRMDTGQGGVLGLLAPVLSYKKGYCLETCLDCTRVCPSGAIQTLDLKRKRAYAIGEALLDASLCVLALGERDCDACVPACPYDAVRIHWDEEQYMAYPVIDRQKCNGCGACEVACPVVNVKAIRVWKRAA